MVKRPGCPEREAPDRPAAITTEFLFGSERYVVLSYALGGEAEQGVMNPAEQEVARLLVAGKSNAQIAATRRTSVRTVANQVSAILRKTGFGSRTELASRWGRGSDP